MTLLVKPAKPRGTLLLLDEKVRTLSFLALVGGL